MGIYLYYEHLESRGIKSHTLLYKQNLHGKKRKQMQNTRRHTFWYVHASLVGHLQHAHQRNTLPVSVSMQLSRICFRTLAHSGLKRKKTQNIRSDTLS